MRKNKHRHITWDDISNYKGIPNRKKVILTNEFLKTFKEELINIFSKNDIGQNKEPFDYVNATYYGFYNGVEASGNFYNALENACKKHNLTKAIYEYEHNMAWYDSDYFDSDLIELMVKRGIIEKGNCNDVNEYYSKDEMLEYKLVRRFKDYSVIEYNRCFKNDIDFFNNLYEDNDRELIWLGLRKSPTLGILKQ